jgi:thioredoxin-related protein
MTTMMRLSTAMTFLVALTVSGQADEAAKTQAEKPAPQATASVPATDAAANAVKAGIEWLTYEEGLKKAKELKRPIVIDFTASWCGWCKRMDNETFADTKVIDYLNSNFVLVKVWGDSDKPTSHDGEVMSERNLTRVYGVRGFPTFWFLDSEGERIGPSPGYKKTVEFLPLVQYVAGSHYKTMSYENYLKSNTAGG